MIFVLLLQVETVSFSDVPSDYCQAILASLGPQLVRLDFNNCQDIELGILEPCAGLEELKIGSTCSLKLTTPPERPLILPRLQSLDISCCVSPWSSRLLETDERLSLIHLKLNCTHFDWGDVSQLFPNLEYLALLSKGLKTLEELRQIINRMAYLKKIQLPFISDEEKSLVAGSTRPNINLVLRHLQSSQRFNCFY